MRRLIRSYLALRGLPGASELLAMHRGWWDAIRSELRRARPEPLALLKALPGPQVCREVLDVYVQMVSESAPTLCSDAKSFLKAVESCIAALEGDRPGLRVCIAGHVQASYYKTRF